MATAGNTLSHATSARIFIVLCSVCDDRLLFQNIVRYRWRFGSVGNVVGRINEVNQRQAQLVLGWVTVCKTGKPSWYVTSHPGQLSLAIPPWVGKMSTGDNYGHRQGRNGEFCVTVGSVPGLLAY